MPNYRLLPELAAPAGDLIVGDAASRARAWVWMGQLVESGPRRILKLDTTAEHVVAVLGKRGTGKSYTLGVLLEGLGNRSGVLGVGNASRATLVLDVLDVFWSSALPLVSGGSPELERQYQRMSAAHIAAEPVSVAVWVPGGFERPEMDVAGTRSLHLAPHELSADDLATLFQFDLVSEPRGMLVEELVRKVSLTGWTDISRQFQPPLPLYGFQELVDCVDRDGDIAGAYSDATRRAVHQRLAAQTAHRMFSGAPTPMAELLKPGVISVLMLGRLSDPWKRVVSSILIRRIYRERRDASFAQKRLDLDPKMGEDARTILQTALSDSIPRTWILIDEAQVLAPSDETTLSGDALVKFAKEGRNFGLSLAVASQQPAAVDRRLMSQVETAFLHQLTAREDIDAALKSVKSPLPAEIRVDGTVTAPADVLRTLEQGQAFFSCANAGRTMPRGSIVQIRPRVTAHGGYEA